MPDTTLSLFTDRTPDDFSKRRTVVCCGVPRGGTSMVAGAIHALGIPMGDETLPNNIEDPVFNPDYVRAQSDQFSNAAFLDRVKATIAKRNSVHNVWGWKYPRANLYLPDLIGELTNPCLVVVFRDPVPIAMRSIKGVHEKSPERNKKPIQNMRTRLRMYQANIDMVAELQVPTLMVSYDLATKHKENFLNELAVFIRQPVPDNLEPLIQFIEPGSYKTPLAL